ncbi:uncharacterized protein METZ01_LOCUS343817, partial [marine metagenome]
MNGSGIVGVDVSVASLPALEINDRP